jgi:menaquinone reductase, multiheme cytochrome c subunit
VIRVLVILIGALLVSACDKTPPVVQPIQFSHKAHTEKGLACDACHQSVEKASYATIPNTETCMMCHQNAITDSAEEEKVRQYAEKGLPIPWRRLYEVPGHAYFSHRRHVTLGGIACARCHGAIGESPVPLARPAVLMNMDTCVGCHVERSASVDCNACHR